MSTSNVTSTTNTGTAAPPSKEATTAKVFVGNLSFKTKTSELAAAFSVAGHVVSANIITRGPRSLGYGFVELESDEDAQKAVQIMHKKEIDGREINVEVAKPRDDSSPVTQQTKPQTSQDDDHQRNSGISRGGGGGRGRGSFPRRRRGFSGGYQGNQGGYQNQGGFQNQGSQGGFQGGQVSQGGYRGQSRGGGGFSRGPRYIRPSGGRNSGNWQQGSPNQGGPRQSSTSNSQGGQNNQNQAPRDPSPTTLFVANIPFTVDDTQLADTFKDFNVVKAHVVLKRNGRSKGFGFVELKSTEDQQKALAAFEKKELGGRELIVKVALADPQQNQGEIHNSATAAEKKETETKQESK